MCALSANENAAHGLSDVSGTVNGKKLSVTTKIENTVAPWDVTKTASCQLCCQSNRTKYWFRSHGIFEDSPSEGRSNISTLYSSMQTLLDKDPTYFLTHTIFNTSSIVV